MVHLAACSLTMLVFSVSDLASFSLMPGIFFSSGVSASLFVFSTIFWAIFFRSFSGMSLEDSPMRSASAFVEHALLLVVQLVVAGQLLHLRAAGAERAHAVVDALLARRRLEVLGQALLERGQTLQCGHVVVNGLRVVGDRAARGRVGTVLPLQPLVGAERHLLFVAGEHSPIGLVLRLELGQRARARAAAGRAGRAAYGRSHLRRTEPECLQQTHGFLSSRRWPLRTRGCRARRPWR